jgi:hypothetical protein
MRSVTIYTPCLILLGDQMKEDEVFEACSTHGRNEKCVQNFRRKILIEGTIWEDLGLDGKLSFQLAIIAPWIDLITKMTLKLLCYLKSV